MLAADLGEKIKTFFETGSNLYIVIAIAVAVLVLIVVVAVTAPKAKKKTKPVGEVAKDAVSDPGTENRCAETAEGEPQRGEKASAPAETAPKTKGSEDGISASDKYGSPVAVSVQEEQTKLKTETPAPKAAVVAEKAEPSDAGKEAAAKMKNASSGKSKERKDVSKKPEEKAEKKRASVEKTRDEDGAGEEKKAPAKKTTAKAEPASANPEGKSAGKRNAVKSSETENAEKGGGSSRKNSAGGKAEVAAATSEPEDAEPELDDEDGGSARPGTVEIYKDARGEFHFRFRAMNGSIVGHSQAYKSKEGCKNGIRSVIANCEDAVIADTTKKDSDYVQTIGKAAFEIYRDSAEQFRYRLVAKNASNILASQGYTSKTNCLKGAESIVRMAKNHTVVDSTLRKPKDA